jgi:hypothetical protein
LKTLMQSHLVYYSPQRRFIRKCFWQIPSSSSLFAVICQKEFSFFLFFIALSDLIVRKFTISHLQTYWNFYTDP